MYVFPKSVSTKDTPQVSKTGGKATFGQCSKGSSFFFGITSLRQIGSLPGMWLGRFFVVVNFILSFCTTFLCIEFLVLFPKMASTLVVGINIEALFHIILKPTLAMHQLAGIPSGTDDCSRHRY